MRVALVMQAESTTDRSTMARLLRRPVEELGVDLVALGHEVTVVLARRPSSRGSRDAGPSLEMLDLMTRDVPQSPSRPGLVVVTCSGRRHLLEVLARSQAEVVLAVGGGAGEQMERLAPDLHVPWLWSLDADDLRCEPGRVGPWVPRHAMRLVVGSEADVDLLVRAGVDRGRCDVVPWQLAMPGQGTKPAGGVPQEAAAVLTSAGAGAAGVSDVIRAIAVLPELRLTVAVDDAHAADTHTIDRWARLAGGLRAGDRIRFVRVATGEAMRVLVRSTDLVVSLPHGRPESSLIAAAMWAETPIVASDLPGVRDLIESGTTGLLLPAGQPRRLARALRVIGRDAPARSTWTWSAHRRAGDRFDRGGTAVLMSHALGTVLCGAVEGSVAGSEQELDAAVG